MANQWYRFYSEFDHDPKVQTMSEAMQRRLVMLFCSRCREEKITDMQRAFQWRITSEELAETKKRFIDLGFIDENWQLLNWNKRQFLSDSSTERTRRYRQLLKQDETSRERNRNGHVTVPEQNRAEQNIKSTRERVTPPAAAPYRKPPPKSDAWMTKELPAGERDRMMAIASKRLAEGKPMEEADIRNVRAWEAEQKAKTAAEVPA